MMPDQPDPQDYWNPDPPPPGRARPVYEIGCIMLLYVAAVIGGIYAGLALAR